MSDPSPPYPTSSSFFFFFFALLGNDSSKNVFAFLHFSQESIPIRSLLIQRFLGSKEKTTHSISTENAGRCWLFTHNCNASIKRTIPVLQALKWKINRSGEYGTPKITCEGPEIQIPSQRGHCRGNEKMQKLFNLQNQSLMEHHRGRQTKRGSMGGKDYLMSIGWCETPTHTPDRSLEKESARSHSRLQ